MKFHNNIKLKLQGTVVFNLLANSSLLVIQSSRVLLISLTTGKESTNSSSLSTLEFSSCKSEFESVLSSGNVTD